MEVPWTWKTTESVGATENASDMSAGDIRGLEVEVGYDGEETFRCEELEGGTDAEHRSYMFGKFDESENTE